MRMRRNALAIAGEDALHLEHHSLRVHVRDLHLEVLAERLHAERVVDAHRGIRARVLVLRGVPVLVRAARDEFALSLDVRRDLLHAGGVLDLLLGLLLGARHGCSRAQIIKSGGGLLLGGGFLMDPRRAAAVTGGCRVNRRTFAFELRGRCLTSVQGHEPDLGVPDCGWAAEGYRFFRANRR